MGGEITKLGAVEVPAAPVVSTPVAEPGSSTSEYKVMIATVLHDVLILGVTAGFNALGYHPSAEMQQLVFAEVGGVSALAATYVVSRGIRKNGTTA